MHTYGLLTDLGKTGNNLCFYWTNLDIELFYRDYNAHGLNINLIKPPSQCTACMELGSNGWERGRGREPVNGTSAECL